MGPRVFLPPLLLLGAGVALALWGGGSNESLEWGREELAPTRQPAEAVFLPDPELEAEADAAAEAGGREELGPPVVRFAVRGVLPDGKEVLDVRVIALGSDRMRVELPSIRPERTVVRAPADEPLELEVHWPAAAGPFDEVFRGYASLVPAPRDRAMVLVPLEAHEAVVTGTITRDGQPVSGEMVYFDGARHTQAMTTDAQGRYVLRQPVTLDGEVRVGPRAYPLALDPVRAEVGERLTRDYELPGGTLTIQVIDSNGLPRKVQVWLMLMPAVVEGGTRLDDTVQSKMTDSRGQAQFQGLPPGDYWAEISTFSNRPTPNSVTRVRHPGGDQLVEVRMKGTAWLNVDVRTADGDPVKAEVWAVERDGAIDRRYTDQHVAFARVGNRVVPPLPLSPGLLRLRAMHPVHGYADAEVLLREGESQDLTMTLEPAPLTALLDLRGSKERALTSLQAVDAEGRLITNLKIFELVSASPARPAPHTIDAVPLALPGPGRYRLVGLILGGYGLLREIDVTADGQQIVVFD